jgi:drug/metabolite transporter (DMT)-like permease
LITAWLFGSAAALMWGGAALASAPAARLGGALNAFVWSSIIAAAVGAVLAGFTGPPTGRLEDWGLVAGAGLCYAVGAAFFFLAVSGGNVSVVAPIMACDGAIAALLAAFAGAVLAAGVWVALGAMVIGVVLVSRSPYVPGEADALKFTEGEPRAVSQTASLAAVGAVCLGGVYFLAGKATSVDPLWVASISRVVPALVALPLICTRGLSVPTHAGRWFLALGTFDALGYAAYVSGADESIAIAAVAASQFAAVAVLGGVVALGERLRRLQVIGVATLILGSAAVALQSS